MARSPKLKVFRTPIGFHDAYVAAPSQKAALEAWGSDHDLFARGIAERVEDPELTREPLEQPGTVIRRLRGTTAEQIAALPKDKPRRAEAPAKARPARTPKPKPDRGALREAEDALADAEARHADEQAELARREEDLARERRALEKRQASEQARLARRRDAERDRYDQAIRDWRG
ncbi:hypothetical protein LK533_15555 [Sphingomonas sp. PL-96]|uniref:hypothetical protein n=1 Tax=Sphingomonas sp. PL-96 TaxID=2887201 RepID=UPI001E5ED85B|nr:hypothetical protein [Sphingomonas sp. PL-96]MCC2978079.1 hypothetical protein [Sphingomonas sp. PL-96]